MPRGKRGVEGHDRSDEVSRIKKIYDVLSDDASLAVNKCYTEFAARVFPLDRTILARDPAGPAFQAIFISHIDAAIDLFIRFRRANRQAGLILANRAFALVYRDMAFRIFPGFNQGQFFFHCHFFIFAFHNILSPAKSNSAELPKDRRPLFSSPTFS